MTKLSKTDSTGQAVQLFKQDGAGDMYPDQAANDYEVVLASQTTQVLGVTGAVGDFLARIIVTTNTGAFTIFDGVVAVGIFAASTPLGSHEIGLKSVSGTWNITTAAATSITGVGQFT